MADDPSTLFENLARHEKERTAQGCLVYALRTDPAVRELVAKRIVTAIKPGEEPDVWEEDSETASGWRTDVCVQWPGDSTPLRIELKIGACLTVQQEKAIGLDEMHALVVPDVREREIRAEVAKLGSVPVLT